MDEDTWYWKQQVARASNSGFSTGILTPPNPLSHVTLRRLCSGQPRSAHPLHQKPSTFNEESRVAPPPKITNSHNAKMATSNTTPKTIVLTARGLESDVRLHVLNYTIFHVYSVVLKMNSAFFFKFLDSAEKTTLQAVTAPISGRFKHDWVTKVDDDGTWSLIAATDGKVV